MARFGQGFLQALTQPSYGQGLFQLGGAIGGAPAAAKERQVKQGAMTLVNEALASNDPTQLLKAAQAISSYDPQTAVKLATAANTATKERKQAQMASLESAGLESTRKAQMARAIKMARDAKDALGLQQLSSGTLEPADYINSLVERQLSAQAKDPKTYSLSPGSVVIDSTGKVIYRAPFKEEEKDGVFNAQDLAKTGKYSPSSIQQAAEANGDFSLLKPMPGTTKETDQGAPTASAEKAMSEISEKATAAGTQLSLNRDLQGRLLKDPSKTTGVASQLRTSALNLAGLRDAEEETKTAFLRTRNMEIVNNLPPGVASDRDIEIFSAGFPSDNASSEEIIAYLQASEKILAAQADMAFLADQHLQKQIDKGIKKATMIGYETTRQQYVSVMNMAASRINAARQNGDIEQEQKEIRQLKEVLGFTPRIYRQ